MNMVAALKPLDAMPVYQCHKQVRALMISSICLLQNDPNGAAVISFDNPDFTPVMVTREWIEGHKPEIGGYFVRYEDGYLSYSPAAPFEAGYTAIAVTGPNVVAARHILDRIVAGEKIAASHVHALYLRLEDDARAELRRLVAKDADWRYVYGFAAMIFMAGVASTILILSL